MRKGCQGGVRAYVCCDLSSHSVVNQCLVGASPKSPFSSYVNTCRCLLSSVSIHLIQNNSIYVKVFNIGLKSQEKLENRWRRVLTMLHPGYRMFFNDLIKSPPKGSDPHWRVKEREKAFFFLKVIFNIMLWIFNPIKHLR